MVYSVLRIVPPELCLMELANTEKAVRVGWLGGFIESGLFILSSSRIPGVMPFGKGFRIVFSFKRYFSI